MYIIGAIAFHNNFSRRYWPAHIYDLNCTGSESSWQDCPHNAFDPDLCGISFAAAISCLPIDSKCFKFKTGQI